ncbi:unnamed protein product [Macrosiphum euphorbiae]|uniref:C2H2-type domain-containing protein n=1 Tax=Macrosiphum euphorbiae TaxID=13131 RepID=A0AAV0WI44_9HEMI|nr:unnamed protein product [Macrosiphum euphorbiae]
MPFRKHSKDDFKLETLTEKCVHCPAKFLFKSWLVRHLSRHVDIDKFNCMDCELTFKSNKEMEYHHNRCHTGLKPFACDECDAAFHAPNTLHNHRRRRH